MTTARWAVAALLGGAAPLLGACAAVGQDAVVRMTGDLRFEPTVVEVPVGGTVSWHNDGTTVHTVTAIAQDRSPTGRFDSGEVVGTGSFSHTFDEAGEYVYQCMLHGQREMVGLVVVEP